MELLEVLGCFTGQILKFNNWTQIPTNHLNLKNYCFTLTDNWGLVAGANPSKVNPALAFRQLSLSVRYPFILPGRERHYQSYMYQNLASKNTTQMTPGLGSGPFDLETIALTIRLSRLSCLYKTQPIYLRDKQIGHFPVAFCLCFKTSPRAEPYHGKWKWVWCTWKWTCEGN